MIHVYWAIIGVCTFWIGYFVCYLLQDVEGKKNSLEDTSNEIDELYQVLREEREKFRDQKDLVRIWARRARNAENGRDVYKNALQDISVQWSAMVDRLRKPLGIQDLISDVENLEENNL